MTKTSPEASTVPSPPSIRNDSRGSSPIARIASALTSWLITSLGRNNPLSPSRSAPVVPTLSTVRSVVSR